MPGAYFDISQPTPKMPTLSFDSDSHRGEPCKNAVLGRIERRKEKQVRINIQKALEYVEGGNSVSPKSSPLQGIKAQPLQPLFVREVTHACYQPCS